MTNPFWFKCSDRIVVLMLNYNLQILSNFWTAPRYCLFCRYILVGFPNWEKLLFHLRFKLPVCYNYNVHIFFERDNSLTEQFGQWAGLIHWMGKCPHSLPVIDLHGLGSSAVCLCRPIRCLPVNTNLNNIKIAAN